MLVKHLNILNIVPTLLSTYLSDHVTFLLIEEFCIAPLQTTVKICNFFFTCSLLITVLLVYKCSLLMSDSVALWSLIYWII